MPTSNPKIITPVINYISKNAPDSVLDIGIGFGKWGALAREYTDVINYRFYPNEWTVEIHGIEIYPKYHNPNWIHYNDITIGDACDEIKKITRNYELVIFTDCIEHIEKEKALVLLDDIFKITNTAIISYCNDDQSEIRDNINEDHVSKWSNEEFEKYGEVTVLYEEHNQAVLLIKNQNEP